MGTRLGSKGVLEYIMQPNIQLECGYNEHKAFQRPDPISRDFVLYGNREHSGIMTRLINNDLEHTSYSYESYLT